MADMEGNTGKDLALEKKIKVLEKFEADVIKAIKDAEKNKDQNNELTIRNFQLQYKKVNGKYEFSFNGSKIFELDEKDKFRYDLENIKKIDEEIKKNNKETDRPAMESLEKALGIPETKDLKEIQENREKEEKAKGEKAPEDKGAEEKADKEKPKLENDIDKEEAAKSLGVESSKIIEIDTHRNITKQGGLGNLISGFDKPGKYFISEDKENPYKYHILRKNSKTKQLENVNMDQKMLKQTEGTNPTEKIIKIDKNGNMTEVQARAMYMDPKNPNVGIAMARDGQGRIETMYYRRLPNDRYVAQVVPEKSVKNREITDNETVREMMDKGQTSNEKLQEQTNRFDQAKELEEILPYDADPSKNGINVEEIENNKTLIKSIKEEIAKDLRTNEGIDFPGQAEAMADKIFEDVFIEGKTYEDAKEEQIHDKEKAQEKDKEDDGWFPVPGRSKNH